MNVLVYKHLVSERDTLHDLLRHTPSEEILERSGLQARLEDIQEQLANVKPPAGEPAWARLTFRGRPVVGQHGIFAEFGTKATNAFTDAVAKVAAALSGPLASMGPVPHRDESQLLITSTAVGSFGFELEEYRSDQLDFGDVTIAGQALELTKKLLQSTVGTDDELADSVASTDPRAVEAVRGFLEILATNDAVCALEYNNETFRFNDVGDVRRAVQRLGADNLHEENMHLTGEFLGVLPKARTFEFKLANSDEVIRGKVGPSVADPDVINKHMNRPTKIDVLATCVGNGKPRFVLIDLRS